VPAQVAAHLAQQAGKIRAHTSLPVAVGFGISDPEQAGLVASSDAVVVGSAVVNQIARHGKSPELVKRVGAFVKSLVSAVKDLCIKSGIPCFNYWAQPGHSGWERGFAFEPVCGHPFRLSVVHQPEFAPGFSVRSVR